MTEMAKELSNGMKVIEISNEYLKVKVLNYGCTITELWVKDAHGQWTDCVLGFAHEEDYAKKDGTYLGAFVGRVCNRIAKGTFTLGDTEYHVPVNNGPNSLHGGIDGFSYKFFDYTFLEDGVLFTYTAQDGEEGYPGKLEVKVQYVLSGSSLTAHYEASTDKDTLVNLTNHSYFNLSGRPCSILDHVLCVKGSQIGCVDTDGLFNGEIIDVMGTPFDFRTPTRIGDNLQIPHEQTKIGKGYDHPFLFDANKNQVQLTCKETGITLTVSTSLPQAQIYSANYLAGQAGKGNLPLEEKDALCIETQYMPDSIHKEDPSPTVLKAGETYRSYTTYTFTTERD